jgi:hypothetical protein
LGGKPVGKAGALQRLCVETAFFGGFICKQRQKRFILKPAEYTAPSCTASITPPAAQR